MSALTLDYATKYEIYKCQVDNVKSIESAKKSVNRLINYCYLKGDLTSVEGLNRAFLLIFTSWVEASFLKAIYTPYALELHEIEDIIKQTSVSLKWYKAIDISLEKVIAKKSNFIPNAKQELKSIVDEYYITRSEVRNKVGHGQWKKALNKKCNNINEGTTRLIEEINIVDIKISFLAMQGVLDIFELFCESPKKKSVPNYYNQIETLKFEISSTKNWTVDDHVRRLKLKNSYRLFNPLKEKYGYDFADRVTKNARKNGTTLREEAIALGLSGESVDAMLLLEK